mmetsp:Transcript_3394/g.5721  ORF Transcript_3394/g.5721 Transcript_3394/m.5721 type:complete len:138 (-) Transcript_3394:13-426(-)
MEIKDLDNGQIRRGLFLSVREHSHIGPVLGHDKYSYRRQRSESRGGEFESEHLWMKLGGNYFATLSRGETLQGMPHCIFEVFEFSSLSDLYIVFCPNKHKNARAQSGMTGEFLSRLGIDHSYLDGERDLFIEIMVNW